MNIQSRQTHKKNIILAATLISSLTISSNVVSTTEVHAIQSNYTAPSNAPSTFNDYDSNAYWAESMSWAIHQNLLKGYLNTTHPKTGVVGNWIVPNGTLTEGQFLTILFRYTHPNETLTAPKNSHWALPQYQLAKTYNLPTQASLTDMNRANSPISRGVMARILATLDANTNVSEHSAIQWMYENGISTGYMDKNGRYPKTHQSFGAENTLTRGQIVSFIKRYHDAKANGVLKAPPSDTFIHSDVSVKASKGFVGVNPTSDYYYDNWLVPSTRYFFTDPHRQQPHMLSALDNTIHVQHLSSSFARTGETKIKMELPLFGGFHVGDDGYYYIVFGQSNEEESNTKTVYRVVKYNTNWVKVAHVDVKDVHVVEPFAASNVTMASQNGKLAIYSARLRYLSKYDGLHHQSNIPLLIDTKNMAILHKGGEWPDNHVSHSFASYVQLDGDDIIYADHGDAYPRSIVLQVERNHEIERQVELITFPGEIGDNYTGGYLGGLQTSPSTYLVTGSDLARNSKQTFDYDTHNVFLGVVPKNESKKQKVIWLTNHTPDKQISIAETHLCKVNDNTFVVLWKEQKSEANEQTTYYATVDANGTLLTKPTKLANIPSPGNMIPLVQGNTLTWYAVEEEDQKPAAVTFYTLHIK
ncbi:S-layer homology domain-containing protein [Bacillus sp. CGMCC 1.16541]|uniref:S-layer homology domain-containing protein n=1 Tax=Bacillus sp. CGMCC 1.16541 TaxID=2185143 RepID=UPI000D72E2D5|nr:S-layer homology domain-containing protein [Bacillus sp. CGMCC 1.16541]